MKVAFCRWILAGLLLLALPASANFHTFQIDQVFSNADGSLQFVVLHESAGFSEEQLLQGHAITATHAGVTKTFNFPANLPMVSTAGRRVLIASQSLAALGLVTPDYVIPDRFLPVDGGTIDYASVSQFTYSVLPTDGVGALNRNGTVQNLATNFAGQSASVPAGAVTNVEFYNASLDHYFISALAPDIDALDTGRISGWVRTGLAFGVFPSQAAGGATVTPVCRIIIPPPHGDSHFFGRSAQECADTLAKFPFMTQETPAAFFVTLPVAGVCPAGTIPVYRVFDNRVDANHRYMIDRAVRDQMVAKGWIAEGDGPDLVVMCATQAPGTALTVSGDPPMDPAPMPPMDPMPMPPPYMPPYPPAM